MSGYPEVVSILADAAMLCAWAGCADNPAANRADVAYVQLLELGANSSTLRIMAHVAGSIVARSLLVSLRHACAAKTVTGTCSERPALLAGWPSLALACFSLCAAL